MPTSPVRIVLSLACAGLLGADAFAQGPTAPAPSIADRGERRLSALFQPRMDKAGSLVARVRAKDDDRERDVALATVVREDGYLLTKGSEVKGSLVVVLPDESEHEAKLIAYHRPTDLALLKIDAKGLKPAQFASDSASEVGNWVAAPGPTAGSLPIGVISVGVRRLYLDQNEIENGNKGVLGVQFESEDDTTVAAAERGAKEAGIKRGDKLIEVAGKPVANRKELLALLDDYRPKQKVDVKIQRGENELIVEVVLSGRNDRGTMQNTMSGAISGRRTGFPKVVQHDTVLRPVDCGGPLIDLDGRVLGINIARAGRVETWTLPSSVVQPVLKDMLAGKYALTASEKPEVENP